MVNCEKVVMCNCCNHHTVVYLQPKRKYGFWAFMFDLIMIGITGGLWLIWIFIREMRNS